jgi:hypothetical protein
MNTFSILCCLALALCAHPGLSSPSDIIANRCAEHTVHSDIKTALLHAMIPASIGSLFGRNMIYSLGHLWSITKIFPNHLRWNVLRLGLVFTNIALHGIVTYWSLLGYNVWLDNDPDNTDLTPYQRETQAGTSTSRNDKIHYLNGFLGFWLSAMASGLNEFVSVDTRIR